MYHFSISHSFLAVLLAVASFAQAQSTIPHHKVADKSPYTLFNPTPRSEMRDMATDRPDVTESPITVDAGHIQVELSFFEYTRNHDDGVRTDTWDYLPTNLKLGLLSNLDLQLLFTPYETVRTKTGTSRESDSGFGDDTQLRLKLNLWGDDPPPDAPQESVEGSNRAWSTAVAVMPFVKLPTGEGDLSNDHVEGGLIFPLAVDLPGEFGLGLMAEFDLTYDDTHERYGVDFVHTATLGHDVPGIDHLAAYVEYIGIAPHNTGITYQALGSAGVTYELTEDWTLDCGARVGLSHSADDLTLFAGTSFRF